MVNNTTSNITNIIRPGHYRLKSTLDSDTAKIIRIMGQDPQNPNFWLTIEGERYSDYDIQSGWVFINTSHTESVPEKQNMQKVFKGLGTSQETSDVIPAPSLPSEHSIITHHREPVKKTIEEEILTKCHIDTINKENFDKHGIETKLRSKSIDIDFSLEIPYDIDRLKKTVKLLDLDVKRIAKFLTTQILQLDISQIIEYSVCKLLLESDDNERIIDGNLLVQPTETIPVSNVIPIVIPSTEAIPVTNVTNVIPIVSDSDFLHDIGLPFFNK
jgi:hypothetical protein